MEDGRALPQQTLRVRLHGDQYDPNDECGVEIADAVLLQFP